ncbi:MAG: tetratricopeptide repeat protein [Verrucomicrobiales bacterium]
MLATLLTVTTLGFLSIAIYTTQRGPSTHLLRLNNLGIEAHNAGDYASAITYYQLSLDEAVDTDKESRATLYQNMARSYAEDSRPQEAADAYRGSLLYLEPGSAEYLYTQAAIFTIGHEVGKAEAALQEAVHRDPMHMLSHNELGILYLGDYSDAFSDYERALRHNRLAYQLAPDFNTKKLVARSYFEMGQFGAAAREFENTLKLRPHDGDTIAYLGLCYYEMEDFVRARDLLAHAFELKPDYREGNLEDIYHDALEKSSGVPEVD